MDQPPFAELPGYSFTLADEAVAPRSSPLDDSRTDADGQGRVSPVELATQLPDTPQPLKATLTVEVYEVGGRPVIETLDLPIRNRDLWLGIKPLFSDGERGRTAAWPAFEVVAVNGDGATQAVADAALPAGAGGLGLSVVLQQRQLGLSRHRPRPGRIQNGDCRSRCRQARPHRAHRSIGAAIGSRSSIPPRVRPQLSLLIRLVRDAGHRDTPDKLQVVADKELYKRRRYRPCVVKPPFAGPGACSPIATDPSLETRTVDAHAARARIDRHSRRSPTGAPAPTCSPPPSGPRRPRRRMVPAAPSAWPGWASIRPAQPEGRAASCRRTTCAAPDHRDSGHGHGRAAARRGLCDRCRRG